MKVLSRNYILFYTVPAIVIFLAQSSLLNGQSLKRSYGSVFVKTTEIHGQYQPVLGGMGTVVFNDKLGLGAYGNGMLGSVSFTGSDLEGTPTADLSLKYGYGGVFAEYFFINNQLIRLSFPVKLGYGAVGVYADETDEEMEKSRLLVAEPELHFDIRLGNHVALSLQSSYRIGAVKELTHVSNNTISGMNFGIGLKMISN